MISIRLPIGALLTAAALVFAGCNTIDETRSSLMDPPVTIRSTEDVQVVTIEGIERVHACRMILLASQPTEEGIRNARKMGVRTIVNLRVPEEEPFNEGALCRELGIRYLTPSFRGPRELNESKVSELRALLENAERPVLVHDSSGDRAGAVWYIHRSLDFPNVGQDQALMEARLVGLSGQELIDVSTKHIQRIRDEKRAKALR